MGKPDIDERGAAPRRLIDYIDFEADHPSLKRGRLRLTLLGLMVIVLACGVLCALFVKRWPPKWTPPKYMSLAVSPFRNASGSDREFQWTIVEYMGRWTGDHPPPDARMKFFHRLTE